MTAMLAIAKLQLRIRRNDPWFLVIMFLMPLVAMPLFVRTIGLGLAESGYEGASGAEIVVPGQVVLFGFFVGGGVAFVLFREHGWKTWDRLRASAAPATGMLAGFAVPWIIIHLCYQLALFFAGGLALGLRLNGGSPVALVLVACANAVCVVSIMLLAAVTFRTVHQVQAFQNVGAMALGGLAGAIVPIEQLPGWAQTVAPITPQYWVMEGFREVLLDQGGIANVLSSVAVLFAISAVLIFLAARRFRLDETKEFFA